MDHRRFFSDDRMRGLEFDEDGTWRYFEGDLNESSGTGMYVTNGNLYTEMGVKEETVKPLQEYQVQTYYLLDPGRPRSGNSDSRWQITNNLRGRGNDENAYQFRDNK